MSQTRIVRHAPGDGAGGQLPAELHPVLRRVYANRALTAASELEQSLAQLHPVGELGGVDAAVALLVEALQAQQRVLVVGDFDVDGATSTALALRVLRAMGFAHVDYLVPDRFRYGYGLSPAIVEVAAGRRPDLIITVDNGVASIDGVSAANCRGMRVLVTDHHLPGERLPEAAAIVNPNLDGDPFPGKSLAGVGVVFYLLMALRARLRADGWFDGPGPAEPRLAEWLDLVALGTVADVVPLDHNNRILVAQGLARIRAGRCCPGISALLAVGRRDPARCVAADLGFAVGPRLNAAGRLEDMAQGIECLLADDPTRARQLAEGLDTLNRQRRDIEAQMQEEALGYLETLRLDADSDALPTGLCLYDPRWHQGLVGLLAGRVKERVHRPVIAFAPDGSGRLKGSARSVPGLHVRDALDAVATRHPGLIASFGGHAMAAGLAIQEEDFSAFAAAFDTEVCRHLDSDALHGVLHSDGALAGAEFTLELAEQLRYAGPWGQGFPEPLFDGEFELLDWRVVGERHLKMTIRPVQAGVALDAIAFNRTPGDWPHGQRLHLAYRLDVNEYQGRRSVQLVVEHLAAAGPTGGYAGGAAL